MQSKFQKFAKAFYLNQETQPYVSVDPTVTIIRDNTEMFLVRRSTGEILEYFEFTEDNATPSKEPEKRNWHLKNQPKKASHRELQAKVLPTPLAKFFLLWTEQPAYQNNLQDPILYFCDLYPRRTVYQHLKDLLELGIITKSNSSIYQVNPVYAWYDFTPASDQIIINYSLRNQRVKLKS